MVQEHNQLKERHEEVSLELEILKNEISEDGIGSVAATAEMKQMEQQNVRLKDALIKLKEIMFGTLPGGRQLHSLRPDWRQAVCRPEKGDTHF